MTFLDDFTHNCGLAWRGAFESECLTFHTITTSNLEFFHLRVNLNRLVDSSESMSLNLNPSELGALLLLLRSLPSLSPALDLVPSKLEAAIISQVIQVGFLS